MNRNQLNRYVGVYPAAGGDCIGYCLPVLSSDVDLKDQIEQSIGTKLIIGPGDYIAISQVGLFPKTKTLTPFSIRVNVKVEL